MITKHEMQKRANEILSHCIARRPNDADKLRQIRFIFSERMTSVAGYALVGKMLVKISVPFFADENNFREHFFDTVTHEIAHLLSPPVRGYGRTNRDIHSFAWERTHKSLGGSGQRTHDMQLAAPYAHTKASRELVAFLCPKCGQPMLLGPTQARRYIKRVAMGLPPRYRHNKC